MKRELVRILPYSDVKFRFISNHYDVHLNGTCIYDHSICEFENNYPSYDEEKEEWEEMMVEIYKLDWAFKLKWMWRQWWFEKCVGYHWSYKNGKRVTGFYWRRPKWFYLWIFNRYYRRR
jgi:hypothetical protein